MRDIAESAPVAPTFVDETCDRDGRAGTPLLTVIVPVYNEASTVDELLRRVLVAPYEKQIIVVNDGSTDGTREVLTSWMGRSCVQVLHHLHNRGKGRAIRTGLEHARGQFTIIQDGDLETDPQDFLPLLEPLIQRQADFVIGSRFQTSKKAIGSSAWVLRLGVIVLNAVVRVIYRVRLSDEACCYKVLPTVVYQAMDLRCEGFEFCPEVVAKAARMGLRFQEVGVRYSPRDRKSGKKIRFRDGLRALCVLWKYRHWMPPCTSVVSTTRDL